MTSSQDLRSRWILGVTAVFAMAWAITRASIQSITIDEATTYNIFVFNRRFLWYAANNHILNSTLMYAFTKVLGVSQFTVRLPALIGAAFYIAAAYRLCRLLGTSLLVQLPLFVCLVFSPFIFDYLVAARGYSLALGFLMWSIVFFAESYVYEGPLFLACAVSSACAGMSVNANFSFALVNLATMIVILLTVEHLRPHHTVRLLAAGVLPAATLLAIVSGYALLHSHPGELIYGADRLRETFGSVMEASLFQSRLDFLSPIVFPLIGFTGLIWLGNLVRHQAKSPAAFLGLGAAVIFVLTVALHLAAQTVLGLKLPKDRTALYFFPLFMIAAGVLAVLPPPSRIGRHLRWWFVGALVLAATYFLSCLRLTYFKEWQWDADVHKTYAVLSCLNREHQVTHVASAWPYRGPLNFYQLAQTTSMKEIDEKFDPQQTQVYVVDTLHTPGALQGKDLKIFYRSPTTDLVLAAPPALADAYSAGSCLRL
jgi:hypothetical protein